MTESATSTGATRPHRTRLKICGVRDPRQAAAIAAMGVDAIGVVAVPCSKRFLPVPQRAEVFGAAREVRPEVVGVLVTADPGDLELDSLQPDHGHQVVQLHGNETVERCQHLRRLLGPDMGLWKALRIRDRQDLLRVEGYGDVVDAFLLDAWVPDQLGGTGQSIPLDWLEGFSPTRPWWLAGGLTPENVEQVLETCRPWGLDASSGVESRPGWKNLERVKQMVRQVEGHH